MYSEKTTFKMWGSLYPYVVLLLYANVSLKVSCRGTSSLTFLIDDTGSMSDDIDQVRSSVNSIMNIVFNEKASLIDNMLLVTFNDPDAQLRVNTRNQYTFKTALNAVYAHNIVNWDCWEPSMNGLLLALEKSNRGSYIYVFTDAPAKDYRLGKHVIDMCHKKQTQIVFVLTGRCSDYYEHQAFDIFFEIAAACFGHAFYVPKNDVSQVLKTIEIDIKGNKTAMVTRVVPPGVYTDIPFKIDEYTDYAVVSASGTNVYLHIRGPYAELEKIMWNQNGKVIKLNNAVPGDYVATVKGDTATSIIIVGRTDFIFSHGFSPLEPKSLDDTSPQPIANTNVHLSIAVTDAKDAVRIVSAQILHTNGRPLKELPLRMVSRNFYITPPFVAPSQMFNVAVKGIIKSSGKDIIRIAKIPVTPQAPPIKLPDSKKPSAQIVEGKSQNVEYYSTVKLTCKVSAYPEPKITWYNSKGTTMPSLSSLVESPYEYISYMNVSNVSQGDKYTCYAVNNHGRDSKTISVTVKDPLTAVNMPSGERKVLYGAEETITCDIRSPVPVDIVWEYVNDIIGAKREIITSNEYLISADRKQLKIRKMDLHLVGKYNCITSLKNKKDVQKKYSVRIQIDGISAPKLTGVNELKVIKGETAVIECKIASGVPKPRITWQYGENAGSTFTTFAGSDNVLRLLNVELKHAGRYKCLAKNALGSDEHIATLFVQELPQITSSKTIVYQATEGDDVLRIPCHTTGTPKPVISWKLNGLPITPNSKYSIEDGTLIIRNPKLSDANSYECQAKNEVGSVRTTFTAYIRQAPKISGARDSTVRIGKNANIQCIVKGEPKPKITWQFMENSGSKFAPIAGSSNSLNILNVTDKHAGFYKCVAQNDVGIAEHITKLIVEFPPKIISNSSTIQGMDGDVALRIPCDVIGVPKPDIVWKLNGAKIIPDTKYQIENGALIIMTPNTNDSSMYTCEAKNYIGSDKATFKTEVTDFLEDLGNKHYVYLLEGETRKLNCQGYTSKSQSIKWFIQGARQNETKTPYLEIVNASVSHDGNYTCRVSDKHGNTQPHTYVVDVGNPPMLYEQTTVDDWRGDVKDIFTNCESEAKPPANVKWTFDGKALSDREVADIGVKFKWGHYTCNISNVHGSVQRVFDVKSSACLISRNLKDAQYMPLILTSERRWPDWEFTQHYSVVKQEEELIFSCPNNFRKFPKLKELKAYCNKQDEFVVDWKMYSPSDLQCSNRIQPTVERKKEKCLTDTSELIKVGFNVAGFLETYEVCFDNAKNMPLYTRAIMTSTDGSLNAAHDWFTYPGIGDGRAEKGYTCKNTLSSCCYRKSQLLNARHFNYDLAKYSTFIDPLNAVPTWRSCNTTKMKWEDIDSMLPAKIINYSDLKGVAWSGTHTFQDVHGTAIPRYLWKVLKFTNDDALAIIHVNDPKPTDKDIKCTNICNKSDEPWFTSNDKYTYCCELSDFLEAFELSGTDIGESLHSVFDKMGVLS